MELLHFKALRCGSKTRPRYRPRRKRQAGPGGANRRTGSGLARHVSKHIETRKSLGNPTMASYFSLRMAFHLRSEPPGAGLPRQYVKSAGIGKAGACHIFRHTMATLMLEGGADDSLHPSYARSCQALDTTQIYTHVSIRTLKQVHTNTHPSRRDWSRKATQTRRHFKRNGLQNPSKLTHRKIRSSALNGMG